MQPSLAAIEASDVKLLRGPEVQMFISYATHQIVFNIAYLGGLWPRNEYFCLASEFAESTASDIRLRIESRDSSQIDLRAAENPRVERNKIFVAAIMKCAVEDAENANVDEQQFKRLILTELRCHMILVARLFGVLFSCRTRALYVLAAADARHCSIAWLQQDDV